MGQVRLLMFQAYKKASPHLCEILATLLLRIVVIAIEQYFENRAMEIFFKMKMGHG